MACCPTSYLFPKAMLYEADNIKICNDSGYQLCPEEIQRIQFAIADNADSKWFTRSDPFDIKSPKWSMDKYFPNYTQKYTLENSATKDINKRPMPDISWVKAYESPQTEMHPQ